MLSLETPRLVLRDFRSTDLDAVQRYAADPIVTRFMTWGPNDEAATRAFLERVVAQAATRPRTDWDLAIVARAQGEVIGGCGVYARRLPYREWEVGYVLGAPHWRQGLGTEAMGALVRAAFERLGAHRLYATVDPENVASAGLLRRLGFRQEGHQRADTWVRGRWRDSLVFARLASDPEPGAGAASP